MMLIGVGNEFRRDDGGWARRGGAPARPGAAGGVELVLTDGEPTRLIEAWTGRRSPSWSTPSAPIRPAQARSAGSCWIGPGRGDADGELARVRPR
jgi:hydrogenase maturation protease